MEFTPEAALDAVPFCRLLGMEITKLDKDEVRARLDWSPERSTVGGAMNGGAIMGLADNAGALLAFLNLPEGAMGTTTISSSTNFLRGIRDGYAEAVTNLLHAGRSTVVVETEILDADGRLVAKVTQAQAVLR